MTFTNAFLASLPPFHGTRPKSYYLYDLLFLRRMNRLSIVMKERSENDRAKEGWRWEENGLGTPVMPPTGKFDFLIFLVVFLFEFRLFILHHDAFVLSFKPKPFLIYSLILYRRLSNLVESFDFSPTFDSSSRCSSKSRQKKNLHAMKMKKWREIRSSSGWADHRGANALYVLSFYMLFFWFRLRKHWTLDIWGGCRSRRFKKLPCRPLARLYMNVNCVEDFGTELMLWYSTDKDVEAVLSTDKTTSDSLILPREDLCLAVLATSIIFNNLNKDSYYMPPQRGGPSPASCILRPRTRYPRTRNPRTRNPQ